MNELGTLHQSLIRTLPDTAVLKLDAPLRSNQAGWLDIECFGKWIAVEWRPGRGFGVSLNEGMEEDPTKYLFAGPDAVFENWREAQEHILSLLHASDGIQSKPRRVARG